jgi:hypothetical protein
MAKKERVDLAASDKAANGPDATEAAKIPDAMPVAAAPAQAAATSPPAPDVAMVEQILERAATFGF